MRILYISSGYRHIYRYFDQAIMNAFEKLNFPAIFITNNTSFIKVKKICRTFAPTIVLTLLGEKLSLTWLHYFQQQNIQRIVWLTEDPYYTDRVVKKLPYFDLIFTINRRSLSYYKQLGYNHVFHLPLATDDEIFFPRKKQRLYESDICFVGAPYPDRIELVHHLLNETSHHLLLIGLWEKHLSFSLMDKVTVINRWLPPNRVAAYYSNAKIVINTHRPANATFNENNAKVENESINNRTFDINGCAAFQLIEDMPDLRQHFTVEKELVSFQSPSELITFIDYYMKNEQLRKEIGENGRKRVLRQHTFSERIKQMSELIRSLSSK